MVTNRRMRLENTMQEWLEAIENTQTRMHYERVLADFLRFVKTRKIAWEDIFTIETLRDFQRETTLTKTTGAIRGLSFHLYSQNKIREPIHQPNYQLDLPSVYEQYLDWYERSSQVPYARVKGRRRVLCGFHRWLEKEKIELASLRIGDVDRFLAGFHERFAPGTCRSYRFFVRDFLTYLYQERKILKRDLAPLVVGPRLYAQAKPAKFLRAQEVQRLFASLQLSSAWHIRTYAIVHLAYTLGLRPIEISLIRLDDIAFGKAELTLRNRKSQNPITFPLPDNTLKAIAAYLIGVRPKSKERTLFLTLLRPYGPMSAPTVVGSIAKCMRQANVPGSAYWLRHTYAQNLLEAGLSVFEIKQMLGHEKIESTKSYLQVHIQLMREVLFDETL